MTTKNDHAGRGAAATILFQNLEAGSAVKFIDAKLTDQMPPFLVLETDFKEIGVRYRVELIVVGAESVPLEDSAAPASPKPKTVPARLALPVGFQREIQAGETVVVEPDERPPLDFEGNRLMIPGAEGEPFLVVGIQAGGAAQFSSDSPVPQHVFGERASPVVFVMTRTTAEHPTVSLTIKNTGTEPAVFRAALVGTAPSGRPTHGTD